jgi:intraflagellar transport protein 122
MRTVTLWTDRVAPETDGVKPPVNDVCYRPDGAQVIAAVGNRVHVYDALGDLLHTLRGHKDTVNCVSYCYDNKQFASGGADKMVIIWTSRGEGILKFAHNESIQSVAYNPVTHQLLSVTATDFGMWSTQQKNVVKHKLTSKGLCGAWSSDGQHFAIGMFGGTISIRNKAGEEKTTIKRSAPVWTLAWNPNRDEGDVLCVGTWDRKLSFYHVNGRQVGRDKELGFDPCCVSYYVTGDYLLVSGSDRKASLYTKDGTFLVNLAESLDWVWSVKQRPRQNTICLGTNDGVVATYNLTISTVHSIYQEQYVYRDVMTDVIIQLLTVDRKLRIPCKDYVKKVAIYRDRLAVQLNDKVIVYELFYDDQYELKHRVKERINKKLECSLLCVTSANLILCQDKRLTSYDFSGTKRREWVVESVIRYIKVVGGLPEREALLVGLKNGAVVKIFVDNAFPIQLVKLTVPIRCLDLSASRSKLAVVDDSSNCLVYSLKTKELLFQEPGANAVSWNSDHEDILCYSGNGMLSIKTGTLPPYQQKLQGFVVGFKGNKVFCLHFATMSTVDVPHSHAVHRYVERKQFSDAYRIACLGVTEDDWKMLGMAAMQSLALDVARKAFIRIREVKYVELLNRVELDRRVAGGDETFLLGDILAFQGKYHEAARCFIKSGLDARAIEMFCDMKMWDEARKVCTNDEHLKELIRRQARWAEETGDRAEAAKLWLAASDFSRAIKLLGEAGTIEPLVEVCRTLPKTDAASIAQCGAIFRQCGSFEHAIEAYTRIGDSQSLLQLHVEMGNWPQAFLLLDRFPQHAGDVFVPYAAWLAMNDRFEEAQEAFRKANRPKEALRMMEQLAANSVVTKRFDDASFFFYKLAQDCVTHGPLVKGGVAPPPLTDEDVTRRVAKHDVLLRRAELYYAYQQIHKFASMPYPTNEPAILFNCARYLVATLAEFPDIPMNISKLEILLVLGRLATTLEMHRMARQIYEKLQQFVVPTQVMEQLDVATLVIRGRPYQDREDLLPVCHRCHQASAGLSSHGDRCNNCLHPFVRSLVSYEVLPLVEFAIADGLTDAEAERIVFTGGASKSKVRPQEWSETRPGGAEVMTFNDEVVDAALAGMDGGGGGAAAHGGDPFTAQMVQLQMTAKTHWYQPIVCDEAMLRQLKSDDIFIVKREYAVGVPMRWRYYRNMVPSFAVSMSPCGHFFRAHEYEFEVLRTGATPFSRIKQAAAGADHE